MSNTEPHIEYIRVERHSGSGTDSRMEVWFLSVSMDDDDVDDIDNNEPRSKYE